MRDLKVLSIVKDVSRQWTNYGDAKGLIRAFSGVVFLAGQPAAPLQCAVTVRFYMGRSSKASVVYCTFWAHNATMSVAGSGRAGGYGYCKQSAALADAITAAGITMSRSIHGTGEIREAINALVEYLCPGAPREIFEH